ncbi:MAG: branched-chain amino acid ABC transporter permease [Burkholderiaceae bacterium]|nr:branched-chain amino acid ABC transporter permease [Burkholderiaceae bacterium]
MVRHANRAAIAFAALAAAALAPLWLPPYFVYLLTELVIWALVAISLDLLIGYSGLPSFGHAVFFGVPAYAFGIAATRSESFAIALASALLAIVAVSVLVGYLATRTGGVGYIVVTLLCSFAFFIGAFAWTALTGGENGLYVPAEMSMASLSAHARYLVVLGIGSLAGGFVWWLTKSPYGLVLLGIKANERRMQAMGYRTQKYKFQITVLAGAIAGIAGVLYALVVRTLSADLVGPELSTEAVIWVLLGGAQTLIGPVLGAALFISLKQILNNIPAYPILLGLLFVAVVVWAPSGLVKLRFPRSRLPRLRATRIDERTQD